MKKILLRLSAFLLVLVIASSLSIGVAASDEDFVEWEMSYDGNKLSRDDGRVYYLLDEAGLYLYTHRVYCFEDEVIYGNVYATHRDAEIVWIDFQGERSFYATEKGYGYIRAILDGESDNFRFAIDNMLYTDLLADGLISELDSYAAEVTGANGVVFDVSDLEYTMRYDLVIIDETDTVGCIYGALYYIEEVYYYLNYSELPNHYFDADGNFSYRKGEVTLAPLDEMLTSAVLGALDTLSDYDMEYVWEDDSFDFGVVEYNDMSIVVFWIFYAILGFVAPAIIGVIGIVLANKRKYRSKYWYVMSGMAGAWALVSLVLMLMLLFL